MTEAVMYFTRQTVALFGGCELFYLSRVIPQQLICFCERVPRIALAGGHPCEDHNEDYSGAVNDGESNGVDPTAAQ
jgi:hypothetical protein